MSDYKTIRLYRKRPVVIEAMKWDGSAEVMSWIAEEGKRELSASFKTNKPTLTIHTLEGDMTADFGDYIIKGVKGEFYPCKPDIFDMTYEEIDIVL